MSPAPTRRPAAPRSVPAGSSRSASTRSASVGTPAARSSSRESARDQSPANAVIEEASGRTRSWWGVWDTPLTSYYLLSGATALLLVLGLVMVLSSSSVDSLDAGDSVYAVFLNQIKFAVVGLVPMLIATRLRPTFYKRIAWWALGASFLLQLLIFSPLARGKNGNLNWVYLGGGITIQPSEFMKVALAVWLGVVLGRKLDLLSDWRHATIPAVPVILAAVGLVVAGHDLGTALVLMALAAGALFVAGVPGRIFVVAAAALVAIAGMLVVSSDNRSGRISAWLGTGGGSDVQGATYQTLHGMWGLGTGGLTGVGLGAGRQKWSYLPEAHNDFIFSVIGEELGLVGSLAVLFLFALLGVAMLRVIRRHPDPAVKIATAAIACWILGQALMNIGVVIGLLPVIGVPLPLVSAGGSALIATMVGIGIVIAFARDEPGAREVLHARPGVIRKSIAVVGRARQRKSQQPPSGANS